MNKKHGGNKVKDKTEDIQGFFQHLIVFVVVNVVLIAINLISSPDSLWFYWVTLFWGIGVVIQAFDAFSFDRKLTEWVTSERGASKRAPEREPKAEVRSGSKRTSDTELEAITTKASELIDRMRASAPDPEP